MELFIMLLLTFLFVFEINAMYDEMLCVTAAGLRASNSRNTSVWPELIRLGTRRVVTATRSITVMEYYFYLRAGTRTSHTERWRPCPLGTLYYLVVGHLDSQLR